MKKLLLLFFIAAMTLPQIVTAQETQKLRDGFMNKVSKGGQTGYIESEKLFETIKKWKYLGGSEWHLNILYSNEATGEMVLSGWHKLNLNLYCTADYLGQIEEAEANFKISITRGEEDSYNAGKWRHNISISNVRVKFNTVGSVDYYTPDKILDMIKEELEVIVENGADFNIDNYFFNRMQDAEDALNQAKAVSEDETLSKRKHKKAVENYEKKERRYKVYKDIVTHLQHPSDGPLWLVTITLPGLAK